MVHLFAGSQGRASTALLAKFRGILQADAYAGFNKLHQDGFVQEAPCMAHIRRKFYDLMETHHSPVATEAVERIAALYQIEKEIRGRPSEERREARNARARPLLESMREWLKASLLQLHGKSETTAAIHYALDRWDALARYLDDAASSWITRRRSGRCALSGWAGKIICSPAPIPEASEQLSSIV